MISILILYFKSCKRTSLYLFIDLISTLECWCQVKKHIYVLSEGALLSYYYLSFKIFWSFFKLPFYLYALWMLTEDPIFSKIVHSAYCREDPKRGTNYHMHSFSVLGNPNHHLRKILTRLRKYMILFNYIPIVIYNIWHMSSYLDI
jgi:hypothetical protein